MCIPKNMIIAIFGASCTGKTSIAVPLANELGLVLRSCGEEIKKRAKELNVSIENLPDEVHSAIDGETLCWVNVNTYSIVEGRFLDFVLSPINEKVIFIQLIASDSERCTRMRKRGNFDFSIEGLSHIDEIDQGFRARCYKNISKAEPSIIIDTSSLTVAECVKQITSKQRTLVA